MPGAQSIQGISSGLDIESIVNSVMDYERRPITIIEQEKLLKTQQLSAYKAVLAKFLSVKSSASLLKRESYFNKTQINVSDDTILSASAGSNISSGTYSLQVLELAHNHQIASQGFDDATTSTFGTGEIKIALGDDSLTTIEIASGNNTLIGIKDAINSANVDVSASIINDGSSSNPYRLLITADETGAVNDINYEIDLTGGDTLELGSGSFDNPEIVSFSTGATSTVSLGGTASFSGDENKIYTFTVAGSGTQTVGTDVITLNWSDGTNSDSIVINQADTEYEVLISGSAYDGLKLSFAAGDLVAGDTFQVSSFAPLLQEATDARVSVGGGGSGSGSPIIVTSDSNSLDDVIPGLDIDLKNITASGEYVTIQTGMDTKAIKTQIDAFITSYNGVMEFIDGQFTYNEDTTESGVLFADYPLQIMQSSFRFASTSIVSGLPNGINSLSAIGIRSDAGGQLKISDSAKLSDAIVNDLDGVIKLFTNSGESTSSFIEFLSATDETVAGSNYTVNISQAATKGYFQGSSIADPADTTLTLDSTNNRIKLNIDGLLSNEIMLTERDYTTGDDLANELQTRIDADEKIAGKGLTVEWVDEGTTGYLKITSGTYGSGADIGIYASQMLSAYSAIGMSAGDFTEGKDVEGTINGESATGKGQNLTGDEGNVNTDGLKLRVTYTDADSLSGTEGTIGIVKGLASKIDEALENITKSIDGSIARRTSALESQIQYMDERILEFDARLASRKEDLYSEFLAMESALSQYEAEGQYLSSQLENLSSNFNSIYNK
ncbi:MAG: flagellar filament capping protein FliD [candidate division Zixibacteria bacterium]|nr:flagellar filament capping protein FliD [candidate division Zixibacteria bacterium]